MKSSLLLRLSLLFSVIVLLLILLPKFAFAQPPFPELGFRDQQKLDVWVNSILDPAGHGCCVSEIEKVINVSYENGKMKVSQLIQLADSDWMRFDDVAVADDLSFSGENLKTVAGFQNVVSTITGTVESGRINAKVTVGSNGALPTGQPITYDLSLTPTYGGKLFITEGDLPSLDLRVSTDSGINIIDRGIRQGSLVNLGVAIDTEGQTGDADWWVLMEREGAISSFNLATSQFEPGIVPTFQGPLTDLGKAAHLLLDVLPTSQEFTLVFGVDRSPNSQLDLESISTTGYRYYQY